MKTILTITVFDDDESTSLDKAEAIKALLVEGEENGDLDFGFSVHEAHESGS